MDCSLASAELGREFGLQTAEGSLSFGFATLRRNLDIGARPPGARRSRRGLRRWGYGGGSGRCRRPRWSTRSSGFSDKGALLDAGA